MERRTKSGFASLKTEDRLDAGFASLLVNEEPGNHLSPHGGSLVAVNGLVTIPQRFAIDVFGLDVKGGAVRSARGEISKSSNAD